MEGIEKILQPFLIKNSLGKLEAKLRRAEPIIHSIYFDTSHKDKIYRYLYYTSKPIRIPAWFEKVISPIQKYSCVLIQNHKVLPPGTTDPIPSLHLIGSLESINVATQIVTLIILYINGNSSTVSKRYGQKSKLERQSIRRGVKKAYTKKYIINGHQIRGIYKKILVKQVNLLFKELLKDRREKSFEADSLIKKKLLNLRNQLNNQLQWQDRIPSKNFL